MSRPGSRWLFDLAAGLPALLLFAVEPWAARRLLPLLGGTPVVWTATQLAFQLAVLAGAVLAARGSWRLELAVRLLCLLQPLLPSAAMTTLFGAPEGMAGALGGLGLQVGAGAVLLCLAGPRLQSRALDADALRRRRLASQLGAALGLAVPPLLLDPNIDLSALLGGWQLAVALLALLLPRPPVVEEAGRSASPAMALRLELLALSALPCALLLGLTERLGEQSSPGPLLWNLPLLVWLLATGLGLGPLREGGRPLGLLLLLTGCVGLHAGEQGWIPGSLGLLLGMTTLAVGGGGLAAGAGMARLEGHFTAVSFSLHNALGGALGGLALAVVARRAFDEAWELPLTALALGLLQLRGPTLRHDRLLTFVLLALGPLALGWLGLQGAGSSLPPSMRLAGGALLPAFGLLMAVVLERRGGLERLRRPAVALAAFGMALSLLPPSLEPGAVLLARQRTLFSTLAVTREPLPLGEGTTHARLLLHGRVLHGLEMEGPPGPDTPTTYFSPGSGVARAFGLARARLQRPLKVAVMGLGVGSLLALRRPGDAFLFLEVDPGVVALAERHFGWLERARRECTVEVVVADGRRGLAARPEAERFDLIVLDAFGGDAVPLHLLTREALGEALAHLAPEGLLALNTSNRHLTLDRPLADLATALGLEGWLRRFDGGRTPWLQASRWVVLQRPVPSGAALPEGVEPLPPGDPEAAFRDERTDLLRALAR